MKEGVFKWVVWKHPWHHSEIQLDLDMVPHQLLYPRTCCSWQTQPTHRVWFLPAFKVLNSCTDDKNVTAQSDNLQQGSTFPFIKGTIPRPCCRRGKIVRLNCSHPKGCQISLHISSLEGEQWAADVHSITGWSKSNCEYKVLSREAVATIFTLFGIVDAADAFVYVGAHVNLWSDFCVDTKLGFLERRAEQLLLWRCLHHCACVSAAVTLSPVPVAHHRGLIPSFSIIFFSPLLQHTLPLSRHLFSLSFLLSSHSAALSFWLSILSFLLPPLPPRLSRRRLPARPPSIHFFNLFLSCNLALHPHPLPAYPALPLLLFFSPPFPHPQCSSVWIARILL